MMIFIHKKRYREFVPEKSTHLNSIDNQNVNGDDLGQTHTLSSQETENIL